MGQEKEVIRSFSVWDRGYRFSGVANWLVVVAACGILIGCTTIKKAGVTAIAAGAGATAGTVLSGGCSCADTGSHDDCLCGRCGDGDYESSVRFLEGEGHD